MPTGNKKTKRFGRFVLGILALALIWSVGYVGTLAWNKHRVEQKNHIQSREVEVEIQEEVPDKTVTAGAEKTKEVWFENTGSAAVFLRAAYVENWTVAKEDGRKTLLSGEQGVEKQWTQSWSEDWVDGGDGWYYYRYVLASGGRTEPILTSITFPASVPEAGTYTLSFQVEAVQVSDEDAVNADATQKAFGKTGTLTNKTVSQGAVTSATVIWDEEGGA